MVCNTPWLAMCGATRKTHEGLNQHNTFKSSKVSNLLNWTGKTSNYDMHVDKKAGDLVIANLSILRQFHMIILHLKPTNY
jgi:hypothetical protein